MKDEKISVWIDRTSEPGKAFVIVSHDDEDASNTLRSYRYSATMSAAKAFARREAKRRGIAAVIESPDQSGMWHSL